MSGESNAMRYAWIAIFLAVLIWSGINPHDYPTWWLEVLPALIGGGVLWYTRDTFTLTPLTYVLILIHCVILMVGGHYTYAEVPLFDWIGEMLEHTCELDSVARYSSGPVLQNRLAGIPLLRSRTVYRGRFRAGRRRRRGATNP